MTWRPEPKIEAMIVSVANKVARRDADRADFIQEGYIAAWQAEQSFDPDRGASLATYTRRLVKQAIWKAQVEEYNLSAIRVPRRSLFRLLDHRDGFGDLSDEDAQRMEWALSKPASVTGDVLGPNEDGVTVDEQLTEHQAKIPGDLIEPDFSTDVDELIDLQLALEALDPEPREVLERHYWDGLTDEQLAEELDVHRTTITRKREAAEQELRRLLKEEA